MSATAGPDPLARELVDRVAGFVALLREHGVAVTVSDLDDALAILMMLDLQRHEALATGLRLAIVRREEDRECFDRLFREYWLGERTLTLPPPAASSKGKSRPAPPRDERESEAMGERSNAPRLGDGTAESDGEPSERGPYSAAEVFAVKDFERYTSADYALLHDLLAELAVVGPWRRSRRLRPHRRGGMDVRRTVRSSMASGGDPLRRYHRQRRLQQRRLTFVLDVSGSMEAYARALLHLAHAAVLARPRVEALAFATQLTRITRGLLVRDPVAALEAARASVGDWSGGTRIGDALGRLNRDYAGATRGAVVVIASDGWDLGDSERLEEEVELLHRRSHRLIWLNPHLRDPRFEPLAKGMSAALPHTDDFVACHDFASFRSLLSLLAE